MYKVRRYVSGATEKEETKTARKTGYKQLREDVIDSTLTPNLKEFGNKGVKTEL